MNKKTFQEKMRKLKTRGPRTLPKPSKIIKSKKLYNRKNKNET